MKFIDDNQLAHYVTMHIGGPANKLAIAESEQDIEEAANYASSHNLPIITIGWGSNIIFSDEGFNGVVLINKIPGFDLNNQTGTVTAGAGVITDDIVKQTVDNNLVGMEALSGIPGTIGAAPVNNIGAFGQEIKDTLVKVKAYDTKNKSFIEISKSECQFGYRDSVFKSKEHGRYIIVKVELRLKKLDDTYQTPAYPSLQTELIKLGRAKPTLQDVRHTILNLRSKKLPNSKELANTGSFYKNPMADKAKIDELLAKYPEMPHYPQANGSEKLSAAWLIETVGLKNYRQNGFWVYDNQPLVLVNESSTSFKDLAAINDKIISTVKTNFGVTLETEPEIITQA
jgi:UDP-N-acetylmuramate dehydrogenase